jgi:uncharacterized protein YecE (DUF72 family)
MTHPIRVGVGGWTYEPWRGVFYPEGLTQKRELEFACRRLTSIEHHCGVEHVVRVV